MGIEEESSQFRLGGRCGDEFKDCACDVDGAIEFDWVTIDWNAAKEEVSDSTTASLWC